MNPTENHVSKYYGDALVIPTRHFLRSLWFECVPSSMHATRVVTRNTIFVRYQKRMAGVSEWSQICQLKEAYGIPIPKWKEG